MSKNTKYDLPPKRNNIRLKRLDQLANLLDSRFRIPGTDVKFGIDPILGLIPGVGDVISYVMSLLLIYYSAKYGASGKVVMKMIGNVILDFTIGKIPGFGYIFDFTYKANDRNVNLLKEHFEEDKHQGSALKYIFVYFAIATALVLVFVATALYLCKLLIDLAKTMFEG